MVENRAMPNAAGHDITLKSRTQMHICGVKEIISFDDTAIILDTVCGEMTVEGERMHVSVLNVESGIVELDGQVNAICYYEGSSSTVKEKNGFFSRFFK